MWGRTSEILLAVWLAAAFLVIDPSSRWMLVHDLVCAVLVAALAGASFHPSWRRLHWWNVATGSWLTAVGLLAAAAPAPPDQQNRVIVGLLIVMFAVVPSSSSQPPSAWRAWEEDASAASAGAGGVRSEP